MPRRELVSGPTCKLDYDKVEQLRNKLGISQAAVLELGAAKMGIANSPTKSTFYRARTGSIRRQTAELIAVGLGVKIEEILPGHVTSYDLTLFLGIWNAYYVEETKLKETYIVEERIELIQNGGDVEASITIVSPEWFRTETVKWIKCENNMLAGHGIIEEEQYPEGSNFFQLTLRAPGLLDGFVMWNHSAVMRIVVSRYLWMREVDADGNHLPADKRDAYKSFVDKKMEAEIALYESNKINLLSA